MPPKAKKKPTKRSAVAVPSAMVKEFRKLCVTQDLNTAHEVRKMFKAWIVKHGGEI